MNYIKLLTIFIIFPFLISCNRADKDLEEIAEHKSRNAKSKRERRNEKMGGYVFDEPLFGIGGKGADDTNIGVNSYLWRATLDTLAILPKQKADPFGGVILTDWYSPDQSNRHRLKVEALIIGRQLRPSALRVSVFRQEKVGDKWEDRAVSQETIDQFEETILTRAREIRIAEEK